MPRLRLASDQKFRAGPPIAEHDPNAPSRYGIALATLDDDPGVRPAAHAFVANKAPWFEITDDLPQYPRLPGIAGSKSRQVGDAAGGRHGRAAGPVRRSGARCGNTLPGLSSPSGSKAHLSRCWCARSVSSNIVAHQVALLDADPVLAGQDAADLDAEPQDVGAKRLGALDLAGLVGVVQDQRVQIAVAGMKHIGDRAARTAPTVRSIRLSTSARRARGIVPSMQ